MPGALPSFRRGLSGALFGVLSDQDSQRGLQELWCRLKAYFAFFFQKVGIQGESVWNRGGAGWRRVSGEGNRSDLS